MFQFSIFGKQINISIPRLLPPPVTNSRGVTWENLSMAPAPPHPVFFTPMSLRIWFETHILRFQSNPRIEERRIVIERPEKALPRALDNVNNLLMETNGDDTDDDLSLSEMDKVMNFTKT